MSNNHNLEIVLHGYAQRFGIEELLRQFGADFTAGSSTLEDRELDQLAADGEGLIIRANLPGVSGSHRITSRYYSGIVETDREHLQDPRLTETYETPTKSIRLSPQREIKRQIWQALTDLTGTRFPWGSLTGIHPTQIAAEVLRELPEDEALNYLVDVYGVSGAKSDLAIRTSEAETDILRMIPPETFSVYLDIPFCPSRCTYCSFSLPEGCGTADKLEEGYVDAVLRELDQRANEFNGTDGKKRQVRTLYIGGGTPVAISSGALERLLPNLISTFEFADDAELTFEAGRADAIDEDKLRIVKKNGFNKVCINPQTLHDETLKRVNRRHTTAELKVAYELARTIGFESINMDLIAGLPKENLQMFQESLEGLIQWGADAITVHTLALKRSSRMHEQTKTGEALSIKPMLTGEDPTVAEMVTYANERLPEAGYKPYYLYRQKQSRGGLENTGFAKPGHESIYNVAMMSDRCEILGLGAGASTKKLHGGQCRRHYNKRGIREYIEQY